nr:phage tail tube protein [Pandoraea apista]
MPLADDPGTFTPSGVKRDHKSGRLPEDGGYTEASMPAKLDLNLNMVGGTDIDALNAIKDEDVTVRLANGRVYLMSQAFAVETVPLGNGNGKLTIMSNTSERIS